MTDRETIQHNNSYSWSSQVIESVVTGRRTMDFGNGLAITWYRINDKRCEPEWVSVPMRLHLKKGSTFMDGGIERLGACVDCYIAYQNNPDRAKFTDITPEEEAAAAALVMAHEIGIA